MANKGRCGVQGVVPPGAMWRWTNTDSWTRVTAACRRLERLGATDVGNLGLSQLAPKKKRVQLNTKNKDKTCFAISPVFGSGKQCIFCIMNLEKTLFLDATVIFMLPHFRRDSSLFLHSSLPPFSSLSLLSRCPLRSLCCRWWSSLLRSSSLSCCCCYTVGLLSLS